MTSTQVASQSSFRRESTKPKSSSVNDSIDNNAILIFILILKEYNQMQKEFLPFSLMIYESCSTSLGMSTN